MTILAWAGAVVIGLSLGLLGSGGSILTVPILVYWVGQPEKVAIAGSLAIVGGIAAAGGGLAAARRSVDWRSVVWFGLPGMAGTYGGAWLSAFVSGMTQLVVFAGVMLLAAWFMVRPAPRATPRHLRRSRLVIGAEGLAVGVLTGFVGVGGGFLIVPALVLLGNLPMRVAVGTSLVIITLKSGAGLWKYVDVLAIEGLALDWSIIGAFTLAGVGGSLAGYLVAHRVPQHRLQQAFALFLVVMGLFITVSTLT